MRARMVLELRWDLVYAHKDLAEFVDRISAFIEADENRMVRSRSDSFISVDIATQDC